MREQDNARFPWRRVAGPWPLKIDAQAELNRLAAKHGWEEVKDAE
jgi:hypothetical protein